MELKTQCRERFKPAVDAINEIIKQEDNTDRPILVAIDGRCGSGKTTLGEYLKGRFDCNLFHMDDFFLRMEQRTPDRMKENGGNVDYERFYETVLIPVQKKESVCYQPFSCKEWRLLDAYEIPYKRINIIEGSYSLHPYFGMPVMLPNAICMAFELATYGLVSGILSGKMKKDMRSLYISLIISMLAGRLVWGLVSAIVYALMGSGFTWKLFFMGGFVNAIPGIVIQLILIPVLVNRLYAAGVVKPAYEGK